MVKRLYRSSLIMVLLSACSLCSSILIDAMFSTPTIATSININVAPKVSVDAMITKYTGKFFSSPASNITVSTDNYTGYTLSIKASNDNPGNTSMNNALINTTDSSLFIPSIASGSSITPANYTNDAYAATNNLNNTWGYLPSFYNSSANTDYIPAPTDTTNGDVLNETHCANGGTNGSYNCPNNTDNYTITLGTRINMGQTPGIYNNTFIITAVANGTPYTITYNQNAGSDTVSNMPTNVTASDNAVSYADTIILNNTTPTRTGYTFAGWCDTATNTTQTSCGGTMYTTAAELGNFPIDRTASSNDVNVYAIWISNNPVITFTAGSNIDCIIVADGSDKYRPYYAISGNSVSVTAETGTNFVVTVVPKANHKLSSWSGPTSGLASTSLLTTTYTVPSSSATLTATGTSGTYTPMSNLDISTCSTSGSNVTDTRNGVSYTVKKISLNGTNTCWMLSNLRLEGESLLTPSNTNISSNFTLPDQTTWDSSSQNHYCEARMRFIGNEYYYNWYAAKANPTTGKTSSSGCPTSARDNASLGDICPKNWRLPEGSNEVKSGTWGTDIAANGFLATTGDFSALQASVGSYGEWWLSTKEYANAAHALMFNGTSADRPNSATYGGHSVRCMMIEPFTISYNANGGTGSIASQTQTSGSAIIADNAFTRTNYYFKGWATSPSATSPEYYPGQITYPINLNLYAVWGSSSNADLYDSVASLTRGLQTNDTNAATGIKTHPTKATSGVYTYNSSVFGVSSDASNNYPIYYYRGILDTNLDGTKNTYGSNGNSMNHPNYVRLDDTCWRIVRTTGSGGVKMIYNGSYSGGTTANSCANSKDDAQLSKQVFGLQGNSVQSTWYYNANRVGYAFNNTQSLQDSTTSTSVDTVFGSDSSPSTNNERSNIKKYIEDTWYANNMTSWTSKLEASAGYCNDRTAFSNPTGATALTTILPYASSNATVYFGAYARNGNSAKTPSLTCPRGTADLYRYVSGSAGLSNQLKYPVALLTADEASFAGSGDSTASKGSGYHDNSYLQSGTSSWLLSPFSRSANGETNVYLIRTNNGVTNYTKTHTSSGVRPVISLVSGTKIISGSGTATSPWVISK